MPSNQPLCQCHDPGFILRLLYGQAESEGLEGWLADRTLSGLRGINNKGGYRSLDIALAPYGLQQASGLRAALDVLLRHIQAGFNVLRLVDLGTWLGGAADSPGEHLLLRNLRALLDQLAPGTLLAGASSLDLSEHDWYLGNGLNELHLAEVPALMAALEAAASAGDTVSLNRLVARLKLPGQQVSFYNRLPVGAALSNQTRRVMLAAGLAMAGLPVLGQAAEAALGLDELRLIDVWRMQPAFAPFGTPQIVLDVGNEIFGLQRFSLNLANQLLCLHNFANQQVQTDGNMLANALGSSIARDVISEKHMWLRGPVTMPAYGTFWLQSN